jgi:anti-sigma B factor antagonist
MSGNLEINERHEGDVAIVSLKGRLDAASSQEAEQRMGGLIDAGNRSILVNLGDLDYISSSGLRVLLASLKRLKKTGGDLRIACPKPAVRDVFTMAGFHRIFAIHDDEASALNSFTGKA